MLRLEQLEENHDLEVLLEPKKKVYDLILEVNGSMLNFHKTVKSSKDIEVLAESLFKIKGDIQKIRSKSAAINIDLLSQKLAKLKPMKSTEVDFI